jgi:hypothetical protein
MARNPHSLDLPNRRNGAACVGARASYRRDLSLHDPSGRTRTGLSVAGVLWQVMPRVRRKKLERLLPTSNHLHRKRVAVSTWRKGLGGL